MNPFRSPAAACLLLALASGCHAHVQLAAPAATADPRQRLQAYERLKPEQVEHVHVTMVRSNTSYEAAGYLELADGTKVYHPEDLLPVLPHDSEAAEAIRDAEYYADLNRWTAIGGISALVAGAALATVGAVNSLSNDEPLGFTAYSGIGLGVGGLISIRFSNHFADRGTERVFQAYDSYNQGLLRRLDLCEEGDEVTACP